MFETRLGFLYGSCLVSPSLTTEHVTWGCCHLPGGWSDTLFPDDVSMFFDCAVTAREPRQFMPSGASCVAA